MTHTEEPTSAFPSAPSRIQKSALTLQADIAEFWARKDWRPRDAEVVQAPGLPEMCLLVGDDEVFSDYNCSLHEIEARWFDERGVIAYAKAALIGPRRPENALSGNDLLCAMDLVDGGPDFADMLVKTHVNREPFAHAGDGAHWLSEFRLLELHPSTRGKGLGVRLGSQFLDELRSRYRIGFFALNAFPLQYGGDHFGSPREHLCREDHSEDFARDRAKLRQRYSEAWGATPFPGTQDYMVVPCSPAFRLTSNEDASKWWLQPSRATEPPTT